MYNGIGLSTARGSGTNGYVQRNLSNIPRNFGKRTDYARPEDLRFGESNSFANRKPNAELLLHDRKRDIEIRCLKLRDELEARGVDSAEVEETIDKLRKELLEKLEQSGDSFLKDPKNMHAHDVHQLAAAKEATNRKFASALGIRQGDFVEGAAFDRELQERKKLERIHERERRLEEQEKELKRAKKELKKAERRAKKEEKRKEKELRRREKERREAAERGRDRDSDRDRRDKKRRRSPSSASSDRMERGLVATTMEELVLARGTAPALGQILDHPDVAHRPVQGHPIKIVAEVTHEPGPMTDDVALPLLHLVKVIGGEAEAAARAVMADDGCATVPGHHRGIVMPQGATRRQMKRLHQNLPNVVQFLRGVEEVKAALKARTKGIGLDHLPDVVPRLLRQMTVTGVAETEDTVAADLEHVQMCVVLWFSVL
ncbi:RNA-splicing factor [Quaeritorhiza haematococci]|nr:RNA-splicing factor [Quaeritorhiza haematococci]